MKTETTFFLILHLRLRHCGMRVRRIDIETCNCNRMNKPLLPQISSCSIKRISYAKYMILRIAMRLRLFLITDKLSHAYTFAKKILNETKSRMLRQVRVTQFGIFYEAIRFI